MPSACSEQYLNYDDPMFMIYHNSNIIQYYIIIPDSPSIGFVVDRESSESDGALDAGTDGMTTHGMKVASGPMAVLMAVDWYPYCHGISDDGSQEIGDESCKDGSRLHVHPSLLAKRSQRKSHF